MVTVVRMVFPGYELPYAVAISVLSIASHSYFQPYKDEHKDKLQFFVLMSSWVVLYCLFIKAFNGWNGRAVQVDGFRTHVESAFGFSAYNYNTIRCFQMLL